MKLEDLVNANTYTSSNEVCPGCDNHCNVRCFTFANGRTYYSGNNCEKVFANERESSYVGVNMYEEKYKRLFDRRDPFAKDEKRLCVGIPRALGIYENYPFWHTLFTHCGIRVVLSHPSSNILYEGGVRTIMADNICFPAKLMHGHVVDLLRRGVERVFYPFVVYERKEDEKSKNSFNCPIVSAYSDVLKSSIDSEKVDTLVVSMNDYALMRKSCVGYLASLGVPKKKAQEAVAEAWRAQNEYLEWLENRGRDVLDEAVANHRAIVLLAGRPYHVDPQIEHKVSYAISRMGVDVITEHVAMHEGSAVYQKLNALCQWAYPNRIFKAAYFVANNLYSRLHFVELTSFGCGPDAFILDEVGNILNRFGKNLTTLKIDDVNNIGSLRLRVRSMLESAEASKGTQRASISDERWTTKIFDIEDTRRTLIAPYFAEGYSEFLPPLFSVVGYNLVNLPMGQQEDAEQGLKSANNDICYPATIVVGSVVNALKSGKYNRDQVAVIITQTGGQCRASNYYSLIKNAMVRHGFADVPVVSLAIGEGLNNQQPGFAVSWRKLLRIAMESILYVDSLYKMYYPAVVRERIKGSAKKLLWGYINRGTEIVRQCNRKALRQLLANAVCDFSSITDFSKNAQCVGVVGEIYVKYNSFSNHCVIPWLVEKGFEVVPPMLSGFFSTSLVSQSVNRKENIKHVETNSLVYNLIHAYLMSKMRQYDKICSPYPLYRKFTDIRDNADLASRVVNLAADFGEGWFLPGEICHLAEAGVNRVVSLQPFGCIANHIVSKGVEKRIKELYPRMNLLFLDFDSGTCEANVFNRLNFLVEN
ncbi:MAG: acyl-CoA dehydratase activase-related protein [Paludibacteraceae bacterium]|nr:acyl-CoA dehydratase activase-related protein [Paludibacteraceae bacterium]